MWRQSKVPFALQIQSRNGDFQEWSQSKSSTAAFPSHFTHTTLLRITAMVSPALIIRRLREKREEWTIVPLVSGTGMKLLKFSLTREVNVDKINVDGILLFYSR